MKSRILVSLFAVPFCSVGVWMLWSMSSTLVDAWQMRNWVQVEAQLTRGGYETNSGDDSDTFEAYAVYTYAYAGRRFENNRVSVGRGGDNIGDYQQEIGRHLTHAAASGEVILVYVDPANPADAIIDRDIRWGLLGFQSIFLLVFGGIGLGLLVFVWRAPREKDVSKPEYEASPWLLNDNWQTPTIRSNSKSAMWSAWAFAAFWNLISAALPFLIYAEVTEKQNYVALLGLLFPLVGIGLLAWALRSAREWTRFGPAPVTLDPFPGSIGGHVGGTIDLKLPYDAATQFRLTLTNIHSYVSGSGEDRSQRENAKWQYSLIAHTEPGPQGTRLTFRFDIPAELDESDAIPDDSYGLWRLNLSAELSGTDLDRDYEIPVYATATFSQLLSEQAAQAARRKQNAVDEDSIRKLFELLTDAGGKRMRYPMGRHFSAALGGIIVGGIFVVAGWYLLAREGAAIFGSVFGAGGFLIAIVCLYMMLNSLEVSKDFTGIKSVRRVLGIPISSKHLHLNDVVRLEKDSTLQTQSGGKHVVHYSIHALGRRGDKIIVGEGFRGVGEAQAAMRAIEKELGLPTATEHRTSYDDGRLLGKNALIADR